MKTPYRPSAETLEKYASVLINFALSSGKGMKKGQTVYLVVPTCALDLGRAVQKEIITGGGYPIIQIIDDDFKLQQLSLASDKQLAFYPEKYYAGLADSIDHWVRILGENDPGFLKGIDPAKIMLQNRSSRPFRDLLDKKEDGGKFTWTLCLYGTKGMAKEAGITVKQYWEQIENACFLNDKDPIATWRKVFADMQKALKILNKMPIAKLHVEAPKTDLWITMGDKRRWLGGSGRNIPSFEIFTSPDWRGTEGHIFFDLPLYRYGNVIKDIYLEFKNGKIVAAKAKQNEKFLLEMIKQKNADKIGEYSLTDRRFSRISRIMAETLYDENYGGKFGNTHLAVGKSYHDTYTGDAKKMSDADFEKLGFNHSPEHTDIISSSNRTVTAIMKNGAEKVIYTNGQFTFL